jgi:hypothetical protein
MSGMDNFNVVDDGALLRSSSVNRARTIYAWALRVADHGAQSGGE